jgi:outer membrane protein assembly factor BamB
MNGKDEKEKGIIQRGYHLAKGVAIVSAVFCLIVCILLIANYFQLKSVDPLSSPVLERLIERLAVSPEDEELREEIRALDLLARKAYFTRQWQIRTGSYLLLGGIAVLVLCLKSMNTLRHRLPTPTKIKIAESSWMVTGRVRKIVIAGGAALFAVSLVVAFLSYSSLEKDYISMSLKGELREGSRGGIGEREIIEEAQVIFENYLDSEELVRNWPYFRGPGGNGIAPHADPPTYWNGNTGEGILWKVPVPKPGNNSPIIWEDHLFLSGADEEGRHVYCFNRHTGTLLWQEAITDIPGSPDESPPVSRETGYAAPTMATDGTYVCAIFPTGDLVSFDFEGNRIWARNLGVPENHYGHSSSLIM